MNDIFSARQYFTITVIPAYEKFVLMMYDGSEGAWRDTKALGECAIALLHLADYVSKDPICKYKVVGAPKSDKFVKALTAESWWFAATRDVANVIKHGAITRDGRLLDSREAIKECVAVVRYEDEQGFYCDVRKFVRITFNDKREIFAETVLRNCIAFWTSKLIGLGIIISPPHIDHGPKRYKARDQVPEKLEMRGSAEVGEKISGQYIVVDYDKDGDRFVPSVSKGPFEANINYKYEVTKSRFDEENTDGELPQ